MKGSFQLIAEEKAWMCSYGVCGPVFTFPMDSDRVLRSGELEYMVSQNDTIHRFSPGRT